MCVCVCVCVSQKTIMLEPCPAFHLQKAIVFPRKYIPTTTKKQKTKKTEKPVSDIFLRKGYTQKSLNTHRINTILEREKEQVKRTSNPHTLHHWAKLTNLELSHQGILEGNQIEIKRKKSSGY